MYSKMSATAITVTRRAIASGVLQDDVCHYVSTIAATVYHFFKEFIEVFEENDLGGIVFSFKKIFVKVQHVLISLAFEILQLVVELFYSLQVHAASQGADHFMDQIRGAFKKSNLRRKIY